MSESYCVVIPADPGAPVPETADALCEALARIVGSDRSRVKDYGKLQFIDCGGNFDRLACPVCAAEIEMEVWDGWMEADWHGEEGFHLHRHHAPCCGEAVTLNELVYHMPQGFARWFASAYDTTHGPLTGAEVSELANVVGMPLRAIYQHY